MGSDYDSGYAMGKTASEAFARAVEEAAWEYGHGGYTGSLAEKGSYRYFGVLPARMTPEKLEKLANRYNKFRNDGFWEESIFTKDELGFRKFDRRVKHITDPRSKSLRTPQVADLLVRWFSVASGDKWGPAAAVRINAKDEREYKGRCGGRGTQNGVYYFAGYCSS